MFYNFFPIQLVSYCLSNIHYLKFFFSYHDCTHTQTEVSLREHLMQAKMKQRWRKSVKIIIKEKEKRASWIKRTTHTRAWLSITVLKTDRSAPLKQFFLSLIVVVQHPHIHIDSIRFYWIRLCAYRKFPLHIRLYHPHLYGSDDFSFKLQITYHRIFVRQINIFFPSALYPHFGIQNKENSLSKLLLYRKRSFLQKRLNCISARVILTDTRQSDVDCSENDVIIQ